MIDETHDATRTSWVETANGHREFPIQNLPIGIFSIGGDLPRGGIAIGESILDLTVLAASGLLSADALTAARAAGDTTLNRFLALGGAFRRDLRRAVSLLLSDSVHRDAVELALHDSADCVPHLPARIGDYTDFYVGIHHATNVGRLFRPENPLLANYKHVPIGYHGRASSVVPSGHAVVRPSGQSIASDRHEPLFGPTRRLDYELELGVWIARGNPLGEPVPIGEAFDAVAGLSLLNDWSARDLQAWEYQPLGPFLAKNFLTTVSPWIVTAEALTPFRIAQAQRLEGDPNPLPYLWHDQDQTSGAFAATLEVAITSSRMREAGLPPLLLSSVEVSNMYWTVAQMVAHHAANGCNLNSGDLLGTGTISGPVQNEYGSLLEISRGGSDAIVLPTGERRTFLEDGDEILFSGQLHAENFISVGFGECRGVVTARNPAVRR